MSDPEDDREILDEIKALEDILAKDDDLSTPANDYEVVSARNLASRRPSLPSRGFGEVTPHRESEIVVSDVDNPRNAYATNKKLIEHLRESKRELLSILEKCIENKAIVEEKIRVAATNTRSAKIYIAAAGMPYFKDAKQFPAPRNRDLLEKIRNRELIFTELSYTCPWTAKDRNVLWRAIRREASADVLAKESLSESRESPEEVLNLPKDFRAMIGPLDTREFDWMRIAVGDFDDRHTSEECRVMWRVFLHPDINRYRWTKDEDTKITLLSEKYNHQDWESLAKELGTNRSGYQCFIRYNTNNRAPCFEDRSWTEEEDARLKGCIDKFKIGHYIPWGLVARYMDGRNKSQVYFRWRYNAAPHLKKGRFTKEEDSLFLEAVAEYGENFGRISERVMPNRSSAQLSDHYRTLVQRKRGLRNLWSVSDDAMLLKLYGKYGADWSSIARELPGKSRTQVRHRHKSILRHWDKGVSLYDIPRVYDRSEDNTADAAETIELLEQQRFRESNDKTCGEMRDIDAELVKFFQFIPPTPRPGRKQKYYSDEDLEDRTKSLNVILKTLNAELSIPDNPENRDLTEKDKQLLESLKDLRQTELEVAKPSTVAVEHTRMRMYGPETSDDSVGRHFSPLCPGKCGTKMILLEQEIIDYQQKRDFDHCRLNLSMEFETPEIIVDSIGDEANSIFDKLMGMFQRTELSRKSIVEKIYVIPPRETSTILSRVGETTTGKSQCGEDNQRDINHGVKKRKDRRTAEFWNNTVCDGIIHEEGPVGSCVEPNYYTLLGLQHILSRENLVSTLPESTIPMTERATRAMDTLTKRLTQLFKYPIGLSHIVRPEIRVGNFQKTTISGNDEPDFSSESSNPTKRRRKK